MARVRSPNYPQFSLAEAIKRAAVVFEKERQHPMPKEVLVKHLGYGTVNGASLGAISAMLKYGLVSHDGDSYRVTERALTVLHPHNDAEKHAALKAAAFAPPLFAELADHFSGGPPSDENLRAYLVRRGFAESALASVIHAFRETMAMVSADSTPKPSESVPRPGASMQTVAQPVAESPPINVRDNVVKVAVTDNRLDVSAALLDQKGVERLIRVLQANKELLPESLSAVPESGPAN